MVFAGHDGLWFRDDNGFHEPMVYDLVFRDDVEY